MYSRCCIFIVLTFGVKLITCRTVRVCENSLLEISCGSNVILPLCASYGCSSSFGQNICPSNGCNDNSNCNNNLNALRTIIHNIQRHPTYCSINASDSIFEESCSQFNTLNYLEVTYVCATFDGSTFTPVCEENEETIKFYTSDTFTNCYYPTNLYTMCLCEHGYTADPLIGVCNSQPDQEDD